MPARPVATRRTALVGAGALVVLSTGCDADVLDPRPAPQDPSLPDPDADDALVAQVRVELAQAAARVRTAQADPAVAGPAGAAGLAALAALHEAHLAELGGPSAESTAGPSAAPSASPTLAPSGSPAARRRDLVRHERALQQRLAEASVSAGSAELARVLASMSAAVAQQLAVLGSGS